MGDEMTAGFGLAWDALLDRVGTVDQVAAATPVTLTEGSAAGVRALDVRTIDGLHATVLLDRGMDIAQAWYRGAPLAWVSPTGPAHPAFAAGGDWLSSFHGGLLVTCGTQNVGEPCVVDGVAHTFHGALSNIPARGVRWGIEHDGETPALVVEGVVREVRVLGVDMELRRRLRFELASPRLTIEDAFTNLGAAPAPLLLIYHFNLGWPLIDAGSRLFGLPSTTLPAPEHPASEAALAEHDRFEPPTPGWPVQVFQHVHEEDVEHPKVGVINPSYSPTDGLALAIDYPAADLPFLGRWRMFGRRTYVMGIEPATCAAGNRETLLRDGAPLLTLAPGETHRVTVALTAGVGEAARELAA
ncbi:MAG TPA: DUF4432 family protein [Conexibacter sp.]|nr:DUF4432 family protein [Conexibacter sp.]